MADTELLDATPAGAEAAPEPAPSDSGGMSEEQAAESFLADLEDRGTGSINKDPLEQAAASKTEPVEQTDKTDPAPEATDEAETPAEPQGKPLTYTVNGESKTVDWVQEVDGEGAMIDAADVPKLRQAISEAEWFRTQAQQQYEQLQHIESVGGVKRIQELTEQNAMLDTVGQSLVPLILGKTVVGDDGKSRFIEPDVREVLKYLQYAEDGQTIQWNAEQRQILLERIGIQTERAQRSAQQSFGDQSKAFATQRTQAAEGAQRESQRTQSFNAILAQVRQQMPALNDEDLDEARAAFGPMLHAYERPATAEEARSFGIPAGAPVLDPAKMAGWFEKRVARNTAQAATKSQQSKVTAENTARLANAGKQPPAPKGRPGAGKAPSQAKGRIAPDDDGSYEYIKRQAMVGRFAVQDG